jgi:hypothetical protein
LVDRLPSLRSGRWWGNWWELCLRVSTWGGDRQFNTPLSCHDSAVRPLDWCWNCATLPTEVSLPRSCIRCWILSS